MTVDIGRETIRGNAREFSRRWAGTTQENANTQSFWDEFFAIFGVDRKLVGQYEMHARRTSTGGTGRIDLFVPQHMAVEHKSTGVNLDNAMNQLLDYLPSLPRGEAPWLLVACDFERFKWCDLDDRQEGEFSLDELADHVGLFWWLAGHDTSTQRFDNEVEVNFAATELMRDLHDELLSAGFEDRARRVWLTRILFCVFADDTGIWDRGAFVSYVAMSRSDGSDLGGHLATLFRELRTGQRTGLGEPFGEFTYINGDLFEERLEIPHCNEHIRDALLQVCRFDWSAITPAIFGSLFQEVMTAVERRQLGAHYTTEENILRTIEPLFLDDLRSELDAAISRPKLQALHDRLANVRFFDPACGCGNFLVVAYLKIRKLETELLRRLQSTGARTKRETTGQRAADLELLCRVKVDQFYGIEIEGFPAQIARTALYLADHLANRAISEEFGQAFVRFPIPAAPHIVQGNALTIDWNDVLPAEDATYVFGNPPFIGISLRNEEQTHELQEVWGDDYHGTLDYVTAWYRKAIDFLALPHQRFAFVSTNSIMQGEQVAAFWGPIRAAGFSLSFAHHTFAWTSEARGKAHVHVVILGVAPTVSLKRRRLFTYSDVNAEPVEESATFINGYLLDGPDVLVEPSSRPIVADLPEVRYGNKPTDDGNFIVTTEAIDEVRADPIAAKYLRRYPGARELIHGLDRWCLWLADANPADIRNSPILRNRVAAIRQFRSDSKAASTREAASTPTRFRQIAQPNGRFLCIPQHVSERRPYFPVASFDEEVIASNANFIADDPDEVAFALLSSMMFMAWFRLVGGRIKSDLRFNKLLVYNTFPAPELTARLREQLQSAAEDVLQARDSFPDASLADLYDPDAMPPVVRKAHQQLDVIVDKAFAPRRRRAFTSLKDRQELLLTRYAALVSGDPTLLDALD